MVSKVMVHTKRLKLIFVIFTLLLCLSGCGGIGPGTVARDRFHYTDAISESWKRQTLLNMVKIRYADAPVFLDVSSIISQYLLEAEIRGGLSWNAFLSEPGQTLGGRGRYAERPTITYQPLVGEKFTRSLMTPIRPGSILSLIEAGWRADLVFRICIQSVNSIHNKVGGRLKLHPADPDFYRLTASLSKIQESMAIGMRIQKSEDKGKASVIFFRKKDVEPHIKAEIDTFKKLLGLNPEVDEFKVVYGSLATNDQEIVILSRSMLSILQELGSYIEVPVVHISEKRVTGNLAKDADIAAGVFPLMRVQSNEAKPAEAFVTVQYRGHWFWIDDRDYLSKRFFSFLMFLFTLAETGAPRQAPIITIPAN